MKRAFRSFILLAIGAAIFGCGGAVVTNDSDIIASVSENLKAMENEDVDATMATIDENSPGYQSTKDLIKVIFEQYDLKYELSDLKVIEKNKNEAKVSFTQVTRKVSGPEFRDNKITGVHTLRLSRGKWKIFNSVVKTTDYLD
jgi:predicted small lipoprotein YifL